MNWPPMLAQYWEIKNQYSDYLILFRVGDFFELFYEDAVIASGILHITLTKKSFGKGEDNQDYPMCGMPHHSHLQYCYKLIMAGHNVVVCDQMETPQEAKLAKRPVVQRSITKILTKSTIYYENFSWDDLNHFLVSVTYNTAQGWMILIADIATNEFFYKYITHDIGGFLAKINPEEILISKYDPQLSFMEETLQMYKNKISLVATIDHIPVNNWWQQYKNQLPQWQQFNLNNLLSYLILHGINMDQCQNIPVKFPFQDTMGLAPKTIQQLHLLPTSTTGINSIFQIIDHTQTAMGKRLLQKYLLFPSTNHQIILERQNKIEFFHEFLKKNNVNLSGLGDLSKLLNNGLRKNIKPLDLLKLAQGLKRCMDIFQVLKKNNYPELLNYECYGPSLIIKTMEDEVHVAEGKIIKSEGFPMLQEYQQKIFLAENQIKSLVDGYGNHFKLNIKIKWDQKNGYFMECTKSQEKTIQSVEMFKIIQYGINYTRFITDDFMQMTQVQNSYQQLINQIQNNIVDQLMDQLQESQKEMEEIINAIGTIDVFKGLSQLISQNNWVFPTLNHGNSFFIKEGYHPLVAQRKNFVNNDFTMADGKNFHIIMGPNMGGKSTFLRQNAIIVILAQMGCPVPAKEAILGIADNIFTRIGADDNLMEGSSTFMVEMEEMAFMIKNATPKSLLIIDELGRGTAIGDGTAIARAIIQYLIQLKSPCLFSTHFHNLDELISGGGVEYFYCGYEFKPRLTFTYKMVKGITKESFGIHVAQLAGLPSDIINQAQGFLSQQ
jgi:DNA mismatch repair protein MutS